MGYHYQNTLNGSVEQFEHFMIHVTSHPQRIQNDSLPHFPKNPNGWIVVGIGGDPTGKIYESPMDPTTGW